MSVSVAGRRIHRLHGLSSRARLVLDLIAAGRWWAERAIGDAVERYHFGDESVMVGAVQRGLHASPLLFLPRVRLLASPERLMGLDADELKLLVRAERGERPHVPRHTLRHILDRHRLVPLSQLPAIETLREELDLGDNGLLETAGFADRLALVALKRELDRLDVGPERRAEAATFARGAAATVQEFADYLHAYLALTARGEMWELTPAKRIASAELVLAEIQPLLFSMLDCPRIDLAAPIHFAPAAVEEWLDLGRRVGFPRLSRGVQQLAANTSLTEKCLGDAPAILAAYFAGAQALLAGSELKLHYLTQTGEAAFRAQSSGHQATVTLGTDGFITLAEFRERPGEHHERMESKDG
jgi:hypothetical protein